MSYTFIAWNLENFFLSTDLDLGRSRKDPEKVRTIAKVFNELNPDIAFLSEVGGSASLSELNEKYLQNNYQVLLKKGNSNRGIEIGYLVKREFLKDLGLKAELRSHARKPINFLYPHESRENKQALIKGSKPRHQSHRMSRDLAELHLLKKEKSAAIFLGVHLKSRLDKEGIDWQGLRRRTAESAYTANIYKNRAQKFSCPIFVCGDFNGEIPLSKRDPEFRDFYHIDGLKDFTDHLNLPREECVSFIGMDRNKKPIPMQLDAFLFHEKWLSHIKESECGFYRYRNEEGGVFPLALNPGARHALPSDHYPLVTTWKTSLLLVN